MRIIFVLLGVYMIVTSAIYALDIIRGYNKQITLDQIKKIIGVLVGASLGAMLVLNGFGVL